MQLYLDDQHAWLMQGDGTYVVRNPEAEGPLGATGADGAVVAQKRSGRGSLQLGCSPCRCCSALARCSSR